MRYRKPPFLLLFTPFFFAACFSERAMVSDIKTCAGLVEGRCQTVQNVFDSKTPEIFATSIASNFPAETAVIFVWSYAAETNNFQEIERFELVTRSEAEILSSSLSKLDSSWPIGAYQVELIFPDIQITPLVKDFVILETSQ